MTKHSLQRTCAICAHQGECQHWLDSGRREGYEEFCPNSDYWPALKARVAAAVPVMKGVLAATDGSESADRAIDVAADLARRAGCDLLLVNVAHLPPRDGYKLEDLDPGLRALMDAEKIPLAELYESMSHQILAKAVQRAEARHAPRIHTLSRNGEPVETILGIVEDRYMEFIVVGKRRTAAWQRVTKASDRGPLHGRRRSMTAGVATRGGARSAWPSFVASHSRPRIGFAPQ